MKNKLIVLFLVLAHFANAQENKVVRKINSVTDKPNKDKVFICKNIPKKDFIVGNYTIELIEPTISQYAYNVRKNSILIARIYVYENTIVQIKAIKNTSSFVKATEELQKNGNALVILTGTDWQTEIVPYTKEIAEKPKTYILSYKENLYVIDHRNNITLANR
jgi:hypothetical protein